MMAEHRPSRWSAEVPDGLEPGEDPRNFGKPYMLCGPDGKPVGPMWIDDPSQVDLAPGYRLFPIDANNPEA